MTSRRSPDSLLATRRDMQWSFNAKLRQAASSLRQFPKRGRAVPERGDERLRELIVGSFRLIYKIVADDEVHVIAFIHSARDLDAFLQRGDRA